MSTPTGLQTALSKYFDPQASYYKYAEASLYGTVVGLLALPLDHPLETLRIRCQASPTATSPIAIAKKIYHSQGLVGFYAGVSVNAVRAAIKPMYQYPMMLTVPKYFRETLPTSIQTRYPSSVPAVAGLAIASFEACVVSPLERLKIYLMTSKNTMHQIRVFAHENRGKIIAELFRGFTAVYARQISSWTSFLVADRKIKDWERARTNTEQLSYPSLMRVSLLVGGVNTMVGMPFDTVKTKLQMHDYMKNEGVIGTMCSIYKAHGVSALYAGWRVRIFQYMLKSAVTVPVLDHLEQSWRR